jgi:hypothetical protein
MTRKYINLAILGSFLLFGMVAKAENFSPKDVHCLATAIYFESGNQSIKGQYAVGEVIMNRLHAGIANSVCGIVNQRNGKHWQFGFNIYKNKNIPRARLDYFLMVAQQVLNGSDNLRFPANVLYFNGKPFISKKYHLYCKIGQQLFFVKR